VLYTADFYASGYVSALTFYDRTPHFDGDALSEIVKIKGKNGQIDHTTLPAFARVTIKQPVFQDQIVTKIRLRDNPKDASDVETIQVLEPVKVSEVDVPGRDVGAMVSMLVVGMQQLHERLNKLEGAPQWN